MDLNADLTVPFAAKELPEKTRGVEGLTVLNMVCLLGWDKFLPIFMQKGIPLDAGPISMLFSAASVGRVPTVQKLIAAGATLSIRTPAQARQAPLHIAAQNGHLDVVRILVDNGTPVDIMTLLPKTEGKPRLLRASKTPLLLAIENNHQDIVKFLLESGANVEHEGPDYPRETPTFRACYFANVEMVQVLIAGKADVNARSSNGVPVLHMAIPEFLTDDITSWSRDLLNKKIEIAQRRRRIIKALLDANAQPLRHFNADMKKFDKFGKKIEKWNRAHPKFPVTALDRLY